MNYLPTDKEIEAVLKLSSQKRYKYFVNHVVDCACVWGLWTSNWVMECDSQGKKFFSVWPAKEYAHLCIQQKWNNTLPKSIEIHVFLEHLCNLKKKETLISVFPTQVDKGVVVEPNLLYEDLSQELLRVE